MKNLKLKVRTLALVALLTLSVNTVFAGGNLRINPYLDTDYSIVSVFNTSSADLKLKVYDEAGNLFYSQKVEAETSTQKLFDLSYLADGNYALVLVGKNTRIEEQFVVKAQKLAASTETMQIAENKNENSSYAFRR